MAGILNRLPHPHALVDWASALFPGRDAKLPEPSEEESGDPTLQPKRVAAPGRSLAGLIGLLLCLWLGWISEVETRRKAIQEWTDEHRPGPELWTRALRGRKASTWSPLPPDHLLYSKVIRKVPMSPASTPQTIWLERSREWAIFPSLQGAAPQVWVRNASHWDEFLKNSAAPRKGRKKSPPPKLFVAPPVWDSFPRTWEGLEAFIEAETESSGSTAAPQPKPRLLAPSRELRY